MLEIETKGGPVPVLLIERGLSTLDFKREKIHARYLGGRKSTLMNVTKGLSLDRLDLQLYPLGTGVAQNIRKDPGRI